MERFKAGFGPTTNPWSFKLPPTHRPPIALQPPSSSAEQNTTSRPGCYAGLRGKSAEVLCFPSFHDFSILCWYVSIRCEGDNSFEEGLVRTELMPAFIVGRAGCDCDALRCAFCEKENDCLWIVLIVVIVVF
jgi:hypothetical protein